MENHLAIKNLGKELKRAISDPKVNIAIAHLGGAPESRLHAAMLRPGEKVGAHFHTHGAEIYFILEGNGTIYTGVVTDEGIVANEPVAVYAGDSFCIEPGQVHQLRNSGEEDLFLLFACPDSHLSDDRTVVEDLC